MESGGTILPPLERRQSNKSAAAVMPLHGGRAHLPSHLLPPYHPAQHDEQYDNEQPTSRRRIHYPGDGFDFRRPVMSNSESSRAHPGAAQMGVIDLTSADDEEEPRAVRTTRGEASRRATPGPSRAERPRFRRPVSDSHIAGEEDGRQRTTHTTGNSNYLALPSAQTRPHFSGLRRPTRTPTPLTDMDDIEFLSEQPAQSRMHPPARPHSLSRRHRSVTPYPQNETIDLTEEVDDEPVLLDTRPAQAQGGAQADQQEAQLGFAGRFGLAQILRDQGLFHHGSRLVQRVTDFARQGQAQGAEQPAYNGMNFHPVPHRNVERQQNRNNVNNWMRFTPDGRDFMQVHVPNMANMANMPGIMDYETTGFDLGLGGARNRNRPPSPKYEPPPEAPEGFTRSPAEDEEVVCPNCGDELATGQGETKQEVWVVRTCGHAYCGLCTRNRIRTAVKKGTKGKAPVRDEDPGLPPPFKKCVVNGCGKTTASKTAMFRLYFGGD